MSPIITKVNGGTGHHQPKAQYSVIQQIWDRQYGVWAAAPEPPKPQADPPGKIDFVAMRRTSASINNADPFTHIELRNLELAHFLRSCLPSELGLFNKPPSVSKTFLYLAHETSRRIDDQSVWGRQTCCRLMPSSCMSVGRRLSWRLPKWISMTVW
jgi:hypothetical protein